MSFRQSFRLTLLSRIRTTLRVTCLTWKTLRNGGELTLHFDPPTD
jgi:hypothetical protein